MELADLVPELLLIVALTIIHGFFASAEIAMVSLNRQRIEDMAEEGDKRAATLLRLTEDQTRFISVVRVGMTLAGFFSAGLAARSLSALWHTTSPPWAFPTATPSPLL